MPAKLPKDHKHEYKSGDVKLPAEKILIPGIVSHASDLVEDPKLRADRFSTFPEIVGKKPSSPAPAAA